MHKTEVKGHDTKRSKDQSLMLVYSHRYGHLQAPHYKPSQQP